MNKSDMDGCVIQDATRQLELHITMENIAEAQCGKESSCVIAQAVLAKFPDVAKSVSVGHYFTKVVFDGYILRFKNPSALTRGLKAFDASRGANGKGRWDVVPIGVYTLLPPARTERLGARTTPAKKYKARIAAPSAVYIKPREVTRCPVARTSNRNAKQANKPAKAA